MKSSPTLYNLIKARKKGIKIWQLKNVYSPISLATELKQHKKLIDINWTSGKVKLKKDKNSFEHLYYLRREIFNRKPVIPDSFKSEKIEINKPYIPKKGRDS